MIPKEEGKEKEAPCHDEAGGSLREERGSQLRGQPGTLPSCLHSARPALALPRAQVWTDDGRWGDGCNCLMEGDTSSFFLQFNLR